MSILNKQSRLVETIITQYGKENGVVPKFAAFVDEASDYKNLNKLSDISPYIVLFEPNSKNCDILNPIKKNGILQLFSGNSVSVTGTRTIINSGSYTQELGSQFLSSSIENNILGTNTFNSEVDEFELSESECSFEFTISTDNLEVSLEEIESIQNDGRFSSTENFMFLPPVNANGSALLEYKVMNESISVEEIKQSLSEIAYKNLSFTKTSEENDIMLQVFEVSDTNIKKLEIIKIDDIILIGKVYIDSYGQATFVNLFTLEGAE